MLNYNGVVKVLILQTTFMYKDDQIGSLCQNAITQRLDKPIRYSNVFMNVHEKRYSSTSSVSLNARVCDEVILHGLPFKREKANHKAR